MGRCLAHTPHFRALLSHWSCNTHVHHSQRFYGKFYRNTQSLCEGGELLNRILSSYRGGRYTVEDAKLIIVQILSVVAFFHLQGVVHHDLKPELSKNEDANMKLIDFGLSDFIRPDERLNDIVGSAYYVALEVLYRSYSLRSILVVHCVVEI
ncbi:hypothetical protein HYC85_023656 [Camellia sinensis]|uniref:Protein kinase domain-containing protein n=1 Tax=Camellia sinensis TaxID=4442 RepID=A0A7J7GFX5_CAMSI|nr:hypothetical protein HYC85_023656 [Camellia sinensis]